jgi:hypothetical protein
MDTTPALCLSERMRPWLTLGALAAAPLYVLPVGIWGLRSLRPRLLRDFASGAVALGVVSLVGLGVSGLLRRRAGPRPSAKGPGSEHWRLPPSEPLVSDEETASMGSGY